MSIQFPNTGSFSFTGLTFATTIATPPIQNPNFLWARVSFGITGVENTTTPKVLITNITLSGQGITNSLSINNNEEEDDPIIFTRPSRDPISGDRFVATSQAYLDTPIPTWNSSNNRVSFDMEALVTLPSTAQIYYLLQYGSLNQINGVFGNVDLIAAGRQNTFGLPADVVALITSRFGSVANFLRLRNQGYV